MPCYELLAELLPGVQPMLDQVLLIVMLMLMLLLMLMLTLTFQCADNLASWKKLAEEKKGEEE